MSFNNNLEGFNIVRSFWYQFWNPTVGNFTSMVPVNGTKQNGTFDAWSVSVAVHALVDATRVYPEENKEILDMAIRATLKYRSNENGGCYCVEEYRRGNKDINFDDDAQIASAFICAYEVTGNKEYLKLAKKIVDFLLTGWNDDKKSKLEGGMMWHVTHLYVASCATSMTAVALMRMLKHTEDENEKKKLYNFAKKCINWIFDKMIAPDDRLVWDGCGKYSDVIDKQKWTYNVGVPLTAISYLYKYDHDKSWIDKAKLLAEGATDKGRPLFCRDYPDYDKRYWRDPSYFIQLLIEGLVDYIETFGDVAPEQTINCCKNEIKRHLSYFRKYMFDPNDGLYFMNFEINRLSNDIYDKYRHQFGGNKKFDPWEKDRQHVNGDISNRPMAKCLIGSASAARIFLQGGRLFPTMDPPKV